MNPTKRTARFAGVLYVLMGITAPFSLLYIPRTLIVRGDAAATARNILGSEMLFRTGIVCELFTAVMSIFLVMALYRLLNGVDKMQASLMVILGALVSAPITCLNVLNNVAALTLLRPPDYLSVFGKQQLEALALFFLGLHGKGLLVAQIFWGLWLFPFGILVMRSGFLPRILGLLLIVNGLPYLVLSITSLLVPTRASVLTPFAFVFELGELWIMLWLLIKGARVENLTTEVTR